MIVKLFRKSSTSSYGNPSNIAVSNLSGKLVVGLAIDTDNNPIADGYSNVEYNLSNNTLDLKIKYGAWNYESYGQAYNLNADFLLKINGETVVNKTINASFSGNATYYVTKSIPCNSDGSAPNISIYGKLVFRRSSTWTQTEEQTSVYNTLKVSNAHIKVNNTWKNAFAWLKRNGIWKRCFIWKKINGVWKKGS